MTSSADKNAVPVSWNDFPVEAVWLETPSPESNLRWVNEIGRELIIQIIILSTSLTL
jgi:hypothetical protein